MTTPEVDIEKNLIFEEGWAVLQEAIEKVIDKIEGVHQHAITSEEYLRFYTIVYDLCVWNKHGPAPKKLYELYQKTFEDYASSKVLPQLRGKKDENLLKELVKQWGNHKTMQRWLSGFFRYLDRHFPLVMSLPSLRQTSHSVFYKMVYGEMNDQVRDAVISVIDREREGEQIDQALVKSVLGIYVEMAEGSMEYYEKDFENAMLTDTSQFYSQKACAWISTDSYDTYMLKVADCLKQERVRVSPYLGGKSVDKIMEVVQHELLKVLDAACLRCLQK